MDEILVLSATLLYFYWKRKNRASSTQSTSPFTFSRPYLDFTLSPRKDNAGVLFTVSMPMSMKYNQQQQS